MVHPGRVFERGEIEDPTAPRGAQAQGGESDAKEQWVVRKVSR